MRPHLAPGALLTPIREQDYSLYRDFFARDAHPACYGNSWLYITQACRELGLGSRYYDQDVLVSIGKHSGHFVVVRPLGALDQRMLALLAWLRQESGKPVFIKKLFPEQVAQLQALGPFVPAASYSTVQGRPFPGAYPWDEAAFADDDTYPELIYHIDLTVDYQTPIKDWLRRFQQLRSAPIGPASLAGLRKAHREFRRLVQRFECDAQAAYQVWPYDRHTAGQVSRFLSAYFMPRGQGAAAYKNMLATSAPWAADPAMKRLVLIDEQAGTVAGFACAERLDESSAGLYAGVTRWQPPGLNHVLLVYTMRLLQAEGVQSLNVGGAESASLQRFKLKPGAIEERYMPMLVYGTQN